MYSIVFKSTSRAFLQMDQSVFGEKEHAEAHRQDLIRLSKAHRAWVVFFADPKE